MSGRRSPSSSNSKSSQLPYSIGLIFARRHSIADSLGLGAGDWGPGVNPAISHPNRSPESRVPCPESRISIASHAIICEKRNELAVLKEDRGEMYIHEIKRVIDATRKEQQKTRGEKMKVSPIMLLKTHVEKMSETGHAIICMKIRHIEAARHYIHEKNGS